MMKPRPWITAGLLLGALTTFGATYDVGPAQPYASIGSVPWSRLAAGDTVQIHFRPAPYAEKILISSRGTAGNPIRVVGVPGPGGEQPVITGENATTGQNMNYRWITPAYQQSLSVVEIGYRTGGPKPGYIQMENLTITGALPSNSYIAVDGTRQAYDSSACGVHIFGAEHLRFSHITLTGNGNGFFAKSGGSEEEVSRDIILEYSRIHANGVRGSYFQHNVYTESDGVLFQGNEFGMLVAGAQGSILKDRSAGTVIRYNKIPTAARMLDLVEPQDGCPILCNSSKYGHDFVYGNVLFSSGDDPFEMTHPIHYGGDSFVGTERSGPLYFYQNTMVIERDQTEGWKVALFDVTRSSARIDVRNNIFFNGSRTGAGQVEMDLYTGVGNLEFGPNWISSGWERTFSGFPSPQNGTLQGTSNLVSPPDNSPGFLDLARRDFHLATTSSAINIAGILSPAVFLPDASNQNHDVVSQYKDSASIEARRSAIADQDMGAFSSHPIPFCRAALSKRLFTAPPEGATETFALRTDGDCKWTSSASPDWVTISPASGIGSTSITIQIQANSRPLRRTAVFLVGDQSVVVGQTSIPNTEVVAPFRQGANGYAGSQALTISNLYSQEDWNHGVGVSFPASDSLDIQKGSGFGGFESCGLLSFSGVVLPAAAKITSARLTLAVTSWTNGNILLVSYLRRPWDLSANWAFATAATRWSQAGASGEGTDVIAGTIIQAPLTSAGEQTLVIDLDSAVVQQWTTSSANLGLIIRNKGAATVRITAPSAKSEVRPLLEITYQNLP